MARIREEELQQLKQSISLVQLARAHGVELRKQGKDYVGLCVFHEERTPSMVISPSPVNLFHCFGCGEAGSPVDWIMKTQNVSFRHAVEILRELDGRSQAVPAEPSSRPLKHIAPVLQRSVEDEKLLLQVVDYYHRTLLETPRGLEYLKQRGLDEPELIEHFQLGLSNRTLGYRLPKGTKTVLRCRLKDLGILRASGHEHYNGCLVAPMFDEHGRVAEIYGRKLNDNLRAGTAYHMYLPKRQGASPHRGLLNLAALSASEEIILCESVLDALSFWRAGHRNATSSFGANGFTPALLEALKVHGVRRVFIAFDADEAGDRGAEAVAKKLLEAQMAPFRVELPPGTDANEYLLQYPSSAQEAFGRLLRHARWMGPGSAPQSQVGADSAIELRVSQSQEPQAPAPQIRETQQAEEDVDSPALEKQTISPATVTQPVSPLPAAEPQSVQEPQPVTDTPQPAETVPPPSRKAPSHSDPFPPAAEIAAPAAHSASEAPAEPEAGSFAQHRKELLEGVELSLGGEQLEVSFADRRYRVRGLKNNNSLEQLKVNVLCCRGSEIHVDTFDLYSSRQRKVFIKTVAAELGLNEKVARRDVGRLLLALEELHEQRLKEALEPKKVRRPLSATERERARELLEDPRLLERIVEDFELCGLVGESTNKLVGYLAATSRKLPRPLGVLIQSSSAAGKSSLMDAVLAFIPEEETVKYSAMTGQALYYMGEDGLKHKLLAIAEEEGAHRASYALKLLLSEGELAIASTGKDPHTGKLITHEYRLEGPIMLICSTTAVEMDEELMNRCLVLTVDEGRAQTRAIHHEQRRRRSLEGLWASEERAETVKLHQDAQRMLRPLHVLNPYSKKLTFLDDRIRLRRDHEKYLTLIDAIALLHQYQRPVRCSSRGKSRKEYVEVELSDIELANRLSHELFGRTLDELSPQTRRFLQLLRRMVDEKCREQGIEQSDFRFLQRQVRHYTGWSAYQVKTHLRKLVELEYVLTHRGRRGQSLEYELLYRGEGQEGEPFLMGLIDVEQLRRQAVEESAYDADREHKKSEGEHPAAQREHAGSSEGAPGELGGSTLESPDEILHEDDCEPESEKNAVLALAMAGSSQGAEHRSAILGGPG